MKNSIIIAVAIFSNYKRKKIVKNKDLDLNREVYSDFIKNLILNDINIFNLYNINFIMDSDFIECLALNSSIY